MDPLEARLALEKAQAKSPGFAAILAFFFPVLGAFYVRKTLIAIGLLFLDILFFVLSIIGIGLVFMFLCRLITAYLCYQWARALNQQALESAISMRQAVAG